MPAMENYLLDLRKIWTDVYEWLMKQAEANKQQANKAQRKSDIGLRDHILLFTKHLKLKYKPGKLRPQNVGSFKVLQMIGCNAAKLELPPGIKVHPIFNVALLKKYHGQCLIPNPISVDDNAEYEVE